MFSPENFGHHVLLLLASKCSIAR